MARNAKFWFSPLRLYIYACNCVILWSTSSCKMPMPDCNEDLGGQRKGGEKLVLREEDMGCEKYISLHFVVPAYDPSLLPRSSPIIYYSLVLLPWLINFLGSVSYVIFSGVSLGVLYPRWTASFVLFFSFYPPSYTVCVSSETVQCRSAARSVLS